MAFFSNITSFVRDAATDLKSEFQDLFGSSVRHGLFSNDGTVNMMEGIGILNVEINQEKTIASHPLENNRFRQDNTVTQPRVVTITLAAEKSEIERMYTILDQIFATSDTLLSVMSDTKLYKNLTIQSLPIRRDPSKFDMLEVPLVLHEFIFAYVKTSPMDDPANVQLAEYSSRQKAGLQRPVTQSGADSVRVQGQMTIPAGN